MLTIRTEQMQAFQQAAWQRFENEMMAHCKDFSPRLCETIGDAQLRVAVRSALNDAKAYGFSCRGPLRLYVELMLLRGSAFATDPQYPRMGEILRAAADEMERAEWMHREFLDYLDQVSGPDAVNVHNALKHLSLFARMPTTVSAGNFTADLIQEMTVVFPQKTAYVGASALAALIDEGRTEARRYAFPTIRGEVLIAVLMFAFGHGCTDDPLYPWIARTLMDERIIDPAARAARLERKSITWLERVLAANEAGVRI